MNKKSQAPDRDAIYQMDYSRSEGRSGSFKAKCWVGFTTLFALLLWVRFAWATPVGTSSPMKIVLPPETVSFKSAPGSALANGQCLACHSVEYVETQPPMPRAFWAASVKKMREKFGAAIAEDQVEPLVNYLVENYGVADGPTLGAAPSNASTAPVSAPALSDEAMATRYGCLICHKVDVKVVGPAFKDVVAKYRNDPAAIDRILEQIRNGGSGKWGSAIMPPFPMLSETESKTLANWLMRQGGLK